MQTSASEKTLFSAKYPHYWTNPLTAEVLYRQPLINNYGHLNEIFQNHKIIRFLRLSIFKRVHLQKLHCWFNYLLQLDFLDHFLFQTYPSYSATQKVYAFFEILFLHQIIQESDEILGMFC